MNSKQILFAALLMVVGFSGCGKGLSDEEKGVFFGTINSAAVGVGANGDAADIQNRRSVRQAEKNEFAENDEVPGSASSFQVRGDEMRAYLADSSFECFSRYETAGAFGDELSEGDFSSIYGDGRFYATLSGDSCPVSFQMNMSMKIDDSAFFLNFDLELVTTDQRLRDMNDIHGVDLEAKIDIGSSGGSYTMTGAFFSKAHQKIEIDGKGEMKVKSNSASGTFVTKFKFPDFTAEVELKQKVDKNGASAEIKLNGEKMTEEELQRELGAMFGNDDSGSFDEIIDDGSDSFDGRSFSVVKSGTPAEIFQRAVRANPIKTFVFGI